MSWKHNSKPFEPLVLIRLLGRLSFGRQKGDRLLESDLYRYALRHKNDTLCQFTLVMHELLPRRESLQASGTCNGRVFVVRGGVATPDVLPAMDRSG